MGVGGGRNLKNHEKNLLCTAEELGTYRAAMEKGENSAMGLSLAQKEKSFIGKKRQRFGSAEWNFQTHSGWKPLYSGGKSPKRMDEETLQENAIIGTPHALGGQPFKRSCGGGGKKPGCKLVIEKDLPGSLHAEAKPLVPSKGARIRNQPRGFEKSPR